MRSFVNTHVLADALDCEESGSQPSKKLIKLMAEEGYLAARLGPGKHIALTGGKLPGGLTDGEYNYFYEQITHEEFCRVMCRGCVYHQAYASAMRMGVAEE